MSSNDATLKLKDNYNVGEQLIFNETQLVDGWIGGDGRPLTKTWNYFSSKITINGIELKNNNGIVGNEEKTYSYTVKQEDIDQIQFKHTISFSSGDVSRDLTATVNNLLKMDDNVFIVGLNEPYKKFNSFNRMQQKSLDDAITIDKNNDIDTTDAKSTMENLVVDDNGDAKVVELPQGTNAETMNQIVNGMLNDPNMIEINLTNSSVASLVGLNTEITPAIDVTTVNTNIEGMYLATITATEKVPNNPPPNFFLSETEDKTTLEDQTDSNISQIKIFEKKMLFKIQANPGFPQYNPKIKIANRSDTENFLTFEYYTKSLTVEQKTQLEAIDLVTIPWTAVNTPPDRPEFAGPSVERSIVVTEKDEVNHTLQKVVGKNLTINNIKTLIAITGDNISYENTNNYEKIVIAGDVPAYNRKFPGAKHTTHCYLYKCIEASQTFTVPADVTSISVDAYGASSSVLSGTASKYGDGKTINRPQAKGGRVQATLRVQEEQQLYLYVGGMGVNCDGHGNCEPSTQGGWNGGGRGGLTSDTNGGGGENGGGATDIRIGGQDLTNRVIVAGGAGGAGGYRGFTGPYGDFTDLDHNSGGHGGGAVADRGRTFDGTVDEFTRLEGVGRGGTQSEGGAGGQRAGGQIRGTDGALGVGGNGDSNAAINGSGGGGGGGGYYGGGGSAKGKDGGGGGSSFPPTDTTLCTGVTHTKGVQQGNGQLALIYTTNEKKDLNNTV